ncbi:MAG: hypothetical protein HUJ96_10235 [Marinilabiliaceae bacterium]|nr:hypothetical protein [Marinilabiliaceae bacterium]
MRRRILVFVIMYLYQPSALAGKKSIRFLRHVICSNLGITRWRVTGIIRNVLTDYLKSYDLRYHTNRALQFIIEELKIQR